MARRQVVVALFPQFELLDATGPVNVFTAATRLAAAKRIAAPGSGYDVTLAAAAKGPVTSVGGVAVLAQRSLASIRTRFDTLLVPGGPYEAVTCTGPVEDQVRRLADRARRVSSVCSGTFVLAQAGLLEGRRVTTHWSAGAALAQRHPGCSVEDDRIYVRDGNLWTSAGVTAGIDLALAMVEDDYGPKLALEVARWLVVYLRRPGGQDQFSAPLAAQAAEREPIRELIAWMGENLRADLSVPKLARRALMSERTFARVFATETGSTPAAMIGRLRVEAARRALETTDLPVKQVARTCGFGTVETLNRAFRRGVGVTPLHYRERFSVQPAQDGVGVDSRAGIGSDAISTAARRRG